MPSKLEDGVRVLAGALMLGHHDEDPNYHVTERVVPKDNANLRISVRQWLVDNVLHFEQRHAYGRRIDINSLTTFIEDLPLYDRYQAAFNQGYEEAQRDMEEMT